MRDKLYALYIGDEYITEGTIEDIAINMGLKESTVRGYMTKSYIEFVEYKNRRILQEIEEDMFDEGEIY